MLEAAVIGVPDEKWIERVHALIVLKKDVIVDPEEFLQFYKERITKDKVMKFIEFVQFLPKNPQSKILKKLLRERSKEKSER